MLSATSCFIALLLSSAVFAAPAPQASGSMTVASSPAASSPAPVASGTAMPASPATATTNTATATDDVPPSLQTVPFISLNENFPLWNASVKGTPQPIRGSLGATIQGPVDDAIDKQNPDLLAPPTTDHGSVQNAKWPFSLSHNRIQAGGWARQENTDMMPIASQMAGVDMRLEAGAVRELHWHKNAEWSYILKGSVQITSVDQNGKNFVSTVNQGDLWYFPAGIPHSLQATDADPDGAEFLLVMDVGDFSEDNTFLLTDWLSHVPIEVLEKNFKTDASAFAHIPSQELYIFPAPLPGPDSDAPVSPAGQVDEPFTFFFSKTQATQFDGGSVKIVDSRSFTVSQTIAAAEVTVEPGAIRELHWHPTQDEWSFFLEGTGRVTIFASQSNARTFNYQAGDIGYIPASMGHFVENTGNTTLRFLEIFKSNIFEDISLSNWLALTPPELVKAHLGFDDATIAKLSKTKPVVVQGTIGDA